MCYCCYESLFLLFTCTRFVQEKFSLEERAVYASLCGNLRVMQGVCNSWHDHLWAALKANIEFVINCELKEYIHFLSPDAKLADSVIEAQKNSLTVSSNGSINSSLEQIANWAFSKVSSNLPNGYRLFHEIQRSLMLPGRYKDVIDLLRKQQENPADMTEKLHFSRFAAHLVIFLLDVLEDTIENEEKNAVLKHYIDSQIPLKRMNLIFLMCSKLTNSQNVNTLVRILTTMELRREEQQKCLPYAAKYGFDVRHLAVQLVEQARVCFNCATGSELVDNYKLLSLIFLIGN